MDQPPPVAFVPATYWQAIGKSMPLGGPQISGGQLGPDRFGPTFSQWQNEKPDLIA
jgi:hypothetical protein